MMDNKYLNAYENLIERLVLINGQMYHLGQHISGYIKNLKNKEKLPETFLVSTMPIRDLTYIQNHNYYNLFPTNLTYKLTKSNLDEQTYLLLSQQYGLMIAQAYEELERFIYAILSLYIFSNGPVKGVKDHLNKCKDREALLKELKRLPGRTNNKHLLKLLRKVSNQYVEYEKNNSRNRDLGLWYIAFSIIRHSIIHDLQKISSNEYEKLNVIVKKEINSIAELRKFDEHLFMLFNQNKSMSLLAFIGEYSFLIFKCLSIMDGHHWDIHKKIKKHELRN